MAVIRSATTADAAALARLAERTFRDAFATGNSAANLDAHCRTHFGEAKQAEEIADPAQSTLVAEHDGELIAYAQLRFGIAPAAVIGRRPGEIRRFYVDRDWHGTGLAHRLMDRCLEALRARDVDVAWLGVWEHDPRAIAFHRKFGSGW